VIVSTINVNGIRAAIKQRSSENLGLLPWLADTTADVACLLTVASVYIQTARPAPTASSRSSGSWRRSHTGPTTRR
jgi:exonuclease III